LCITYLGDTLPVNRRKVRILGKLRHQHVGTGKGFIQAPVLEERRLQAVQKKLELVARIAEVARRRRAEMGM
jgi:hypothetical protein